MEKRKVDWMVDGLVGKMDVLKVAKRDVKAAQKAD